MTAAIKVGVLVAMCGGLLMFVWIFWEVGRAATRNASPSEKRTLKEIALVVLAVMLCVWAGEAIGVAAHIGNSDDSSALAGCGMGIGLALIVMIGGTRLVARGAKRREGN